MTTINASTYHDLSDRTAQLIDEALNLRLSQAFDSQTKLAEAIAEIDRVEACNAAIREAGY